MEKVSNISGEFFRISFKILSNILSQINEKQYLPDIRHNALCTYAVFPVKRSETGVRHRVMETTALFVKGQERIKIYPAKRGPFGLFQLKGESRYLELLNCSNQGAEKTLLSFTDNF